MPIFDTGRVILHRRVHVTNIKHIMFTVFNGHVFELLRDILYVLLCNSFKQTTFLTTKYLYFLMKTQYVDALCCLQIVVHPLLFSHWCQLYVIIMVIKYKNDLWLFQSYSTCSHVVFFTQHDCSGSLNWHQGGRRLHWLLIQRGTDTDCMVPEVKTKANFTLNLKAKLS